MNLAEELKNIQLSFYKQGFVHLKNIFSKSEIINLRKSFIKYKKNQNKNLIKVLHVEKKNKKCKKNYESTISFIFIEIYTKNGKYSMSSNRGFF